MKRLLIVLALLLTTLPLSHSLPTQAGPPPAGIASTLGLLLVLHRQGAQLAPDSGLGRTLGRLQDKGAVDVSARFARPLSTAERARIAALGVEFRQVDGQPAQLGRFYALRVPLDAVEQLAADPLVEWLEADWRPVVPAPLDVSLPTSNVPAAWQVSINNSGLAQQLTGFGVTIANFDTGVDTLHPALLDASGNMGPNDCNWDANLSGLFESGVDRFWPTSPFLRYQDAIGVGTVYTLDLTIDWIYQDDNGNAVYDSNELVFLPNDLNGNGTLESPNECLRSLGSFTSGTPSSKIAHVLDASGAYTRGVDLELSAGDPNGHGTAVAGILAGGNALWCAPGFMSCNMAYPTTRRYTGVAPNAELLVADRVGLNNDFATYMPWAINLGADVMLYEYGGWVYEYLDGSSNHEQMIDLAAAQGIVQVVPTGNLHGMGRHLQYNLPGGSLTHRFNVPASPVIQEVYASMTWLHPSNNLTVTLTPPGSATPTALPCTAASSGWLNVTIGTHAVYCERAANSSRGTALYNLWISNTVGVSSGHWSMRVANPGSAEPTNFYIADDASAWGGGVIWINNGSGQELHTATWPSTCDSCIGVASYATRANSGGTIGDISSFSGRGPRFFDGAPVVDIAAPGHYDVVAPWSHTVVGGSLGPYVTNFGGTSAAAPHVAGVAALLLQYTRGQATPAEIEAAIRHGAASDGFTGNTPNDTWGAGKLDALGALHNLMNDLGDAPDSSNNSAVAMSAYPSVPAAFLTVYTDTKSAPPGPIHWQAGSISTGPIDSCLGTYVSAEGEADRGFDEDPYTGTGAAHNIDPATGSADGESYLWNTTDDGLWIGGTLTHCLPTTLTVHLTLVTGTVANHYVNIWFDWNQDGDWGDTFTCATAGDAPEWAVQDQLITQTSPGYYAVTTPALIPYHAGGPSAWLRVTLSEQPAPTDTLTGRADGRGPAGGYQFGETEDYFVLTLWPPHRVYLPLVMRANP